MYNKLLSVVAVAALFQVGIDEVKAAGLAAVKQGEQQVLAQAKPAAEAPTLQSCIKACNGGQNTLSSLLSTKTPGEGTVSSMCSTKEGFCHDFPGTDNGETCSNECESLLIDDTAHIVSELAGLVQQLHSSCTNYCHEAYKAAPSAKGTTNAVHGRPNH